MKKSYFILTDSGGIQEEAPVIGKPVLVMRKVTERKEVEKKGVVKLVGTNRENIVENVVKLPRMPMIKKVFVFADNILWCVARLNIIPAKKQPIKLIKNVSIGSFIL